MTLEHLLSTMNLKVKDLDKMNISNPTIVINQCGKDGYKKYKNFNIYASNSIGLSKSRNLGLKYVKGDIILLTDDDIIYNDNYKKIVLDAFKENKDADIIFFNIDCRNREYKPIIKNKRVHIYNSLRFSSCSIAFRRKSILDNNISFNELFGSNSKYMTGEDTLFIVSALKKGLKLYTNTNCIGTVYHNKSFWFHGYTEEYFFYKGSVYTAISKSFRHLLCFQHLLRHRNEYKELGFFKALKNMSKGMRDYLNEIKK